MVSVLGVLGLGGYYIYKNKDDGEIGQISNYLKSLVYPEVVNNNTSQFPVSNKDTKVLTIEGNKSSNKVTEKSQTKTNLPQVVVISQVFYFHISYNILLLHTYLFSWPTDETEKLDNKQPLPTDLKLKQLRRSNQT